MGHCSIRSPFVSHLTLLFFAALTFTAHAVEVGESPVQNVSLSETALTAQGRQQALMNVSAFGRYSVVAQSEQGTALQLIDRMAGPGPIEGVAGHEDGRLDLFLERGEYKIITHAHESGSGTVTLTAHDFTERNAQPSRLVELKEIRTSLNDFEQRSYWLEIKERRYVAIEAAGRSLGDLRLWKDGDWLVNIKPIYHHLNAKIGQPLSSYQFTANLEPGFYLVTAYGGRPQPWAEQSDDSPLYIRFGIPVLDVAGRRYQEVSPFGIDRWLVPQQANYFRLELPEAALASLAVSQYSEQRPFDEYGESRDINKESIPPVAELERTTGNNGFTLVSVKGQAGQPYILQQFESKPHYSFSKHGNYWISTIHSGTGQDSVDATSLLTVRSGWSTPQLVEARAVTLQANRRWRRRFNLLDTLTLYVDVPRSGAYRVTGEGEGVRAQFRMDPFLTSRPPNYRTPDFEERGHVWHLDAGYYELTVRPELKGILELSITSAQGDEPVADDNSSVAASTRYPSVSLNYRDNYTLYLNQQPGVRSGLVLRELPIDLSQSLPLSQRKGERVDIPVQVKASGVIRARTVNGELMMLSIDKGPSTHEQRVNAGRHTVTLLNGTQDTVSYSLEFVPNRLAADTPLPAMPSKALNARPHFPLLSSEAPDFFDLTQNTEATYNVEVKQPALYCLETSGLLDTSGNLRTRTNPSLVRKQANGVGRNFLIQRYLREGVYQLSVKTEGNSAGHLGLFLKHTELMAGGRLAQGVPARYTLPDGRGLSYSFEIDEAGEYRLRVLGVGQVRNVRLEDSDGWPIVKPDIRGDLVHKFAPGSYRVIIPPNAVEGRVVTLLEPVPPPLKFSGHGPHTIVVGQPVEHVWHEPEEGQPRLPDQWQFELPATADVRIALGGEMQGELFLLGDGPEYKKVDDVSAIKQWRGRLEPGRYRLSVTTALKNNHVTYRVGVTVDQLIAGQQRDVSLPTELELSVANDSLVELGSFGMVDVRVRLLDATGKLVAQDDDRDNDWNFFIARKLNAGRYHLQLDPVGGARGMTSVFMRIPDELTGQALVLPAHHVVADNALHTFPLKIPAGKSLLIVTADSADTVGITVEVNKGDGWQWSGTSTARLAHVLVPLSGSPDYKYRLRLWSIDQRGASIALNADAIALAAETENQRKFPMRIIGQGQQRLAIAAVALAHPGVMSVSGDNNLIWSSAVGDGLQSLARDKVVATGNTLWLATPLLPSRSAPVAYVNRAFLSAGQEKGLQFIVPADRSTPVDIRRSGKGPLLVVAESRAGLSGVQVVGFGDGMNKGGTFAISSSSSVSGSLAGASKVRVWNAGARDKALEVSLRQTEFSAAELEPIGLGVTLAPLAAETAKAFKLPGGNKRVQLALPPQTAALFSNERSVVSTHWSGDETLSERVDTQATKLTLLHAGDQAVQVQLEITSPDASARLEGGALLQQHFSTAGVARVRVVKPAGASRVLHVRGDVRAMLMQDDGGVLQGRDMMLTDSATLILRHQPGLVLAWLDSSDEVGGLKAAVEAAALPSSVVLQGKTKQLLFSLPAAVMLHLRSDTALISRLTYPGGRQRVDAYPQGMMSDLFLPQGISTLTLQAIGEERLSGRLSLSSSAPATIGEGEGPISLLDAGAARLYHFEVKHPGPVGIGVRASSDVIDSRLMDETGRLIGEGVVQMATLSPGRYYLTLHAPATSAPVTVRPVMVGIERPDTGPPIEVIRNYLKKAGMKMDEGSAE